MFRRSETFEASPPRSVRTLRAHPCAKKEDAHGRYGHALRACRAAHAARFAGGRGARSRASHARPHQRAYERAPAARTTCARVTRACVSFYTRGSAYNARMRVPSPFPFFRGPKRAARKEWPLPPSADARPAGCPPAPVVAGLLLARLRCRYPPYTASQGGLKSPVRPDPPLPHVRT